MPFAYRAVVGSFLSMKPHLVDPRSSITGSWDSPHSEGNLAEVGFEKLAIGSKRTNFPIELSLRSGE